MFGAVRRYRALVATVAVLCAASAATFTLLQPDAYRAQTQVTVPRPAALVPDPNYLDGQVLLLQSQDVAARAADIVNSSGTGNELGVSDFIGVDSAVTITPPTSDSAGTFGAGTIELTFTWTDPDTAKLGVNAIVQAFDEVRSAAIRSTGDATIAAIQSAIDDERNADQRLDVLLAQRTQIVVDQQIDLANRPVVATAADPERMNTSPLAGAATGALVGALAGALLAYARATRRGGFDHSGEPAVLYDTPLLGEIPRLPTPRVRYRWDGLTGLLPTATDPRSTLAEAFRFVASSVERSRSARNAVRRVAVVSAGRGAGRSVVAANLALALAEGGTRLLVVDAGDGTLGDLLLDDAPRGNGVAQVISGSHDITDCIRPSARRKEVDVLGPGSPSTDSVAGDAYGRALDKALVGVESDYDLVMVDCPNIVEVATSTALVDICGAVVLVVGPDTSGRDHIAAAQRLGQFGTTTLGYVYLRSPVPRRPVPKASTRPAAPPDADSGSSDSDPAVTRAEVPIPVGTEPDRGGPHGEQVAPGRDVPRPGSRTGPATRSIRPSPVPRA